MVPIEYRSKEEVSWKSRRAGTRSTRVGPPIPRGDSAHHWREKEGAGERERAAWRERLREREGEGEEE